MDKSYFSKTFIRGSLALLPLILTLYPLFYFIRWLDSASNSLIQYFFPGITYIPGTGIILGILTIFILGVIMSSSAAQKLYGTLEESIENIPLVKSLYTAIKELVNYLAPNDGDKKPDKVVVVTIPDTGIQTIGFVLRSDLSSLPDQLDKEGKVAVYIPMSYQIGGFTLFLPESWLQNTNMSVEDAMKNVLTGWISTR